MFKPTRRSLAVLLFATLPVQAMHHAAAEGKAGVSTETRAKSVIIETKLQDTIDGEHRSAANKARDPYRHPHETLTFFGLTDDMTVVEVWPGGGWYQEILAPYLADNGQYIAAGWPEGTEVGYQQRLRAQEIARIKTQSELYGRIVQTEFQPPETVLLAPAGSADLVLTFRNTHSWMRSDEMAPAAFKAMYDALKPGGILGLVAHESKLETPVPGTGYLTQAQVRDLAEAAGFVFVAASDINHNPLDSTDHPNGVWTLPPVLRGDGDKAVYQKMGESHRMTLKFTKPE